MDWIGLDWFGFIRKMSANNEPPNISEVDRIWYRIVRRVVSLRKGLGLRSEGAQEEYVQQCSQREANGEIALLPTPEELEHLLTDISETSRALIKASLTIFNECRALQEPAEDSFARSRGTQFSASQVKDFLQTADRVDMNTLETDELQCSICRMEYGRDRGGMVGSEPSDQGLPGEETPEYPVKLSCRHVFGEWCIKTWLLEQPASCPMCRFHFELVAAK